ncbi:hypothetical protein [Tateyamaria sp.]|uniref:hypothetical protein n=1 Tax=Tateyamaria sp. TaxID=1929288 RepID=UPI00329BDF97
MLDLPAKADGLADLRAQLSECAAAPDGAPRSLPGRAYTDPALFQHECATVLRTGWHCVGRVDGLEQIGD